MRSAHKSVGLVVALGSGALLSAGAVALPGALASQTSSEPGATAVASKSVRFTARCSKVTASSSGFSFSSCRASGSYGRGSGRGDQRIARTATTNFALNFSRGTLRLRATTRPRSSTEFVGTWRTTSGTRRLRGIRGSGRVRIVVRNGGKAGDFFFTGSSNK